MKTRKVLILFCVALALALTLASCSTAKTNATANATATQVAPANATEPAAATTEAATEPAAQAGALSIPVAELTNDMQIYSLDMDGVRVEVIALIASDGSIRTAFNACQVCYDSGRGYYKQKGDVLVCQNCGNQFQLDQLGLRAGGCNPVPIDDSERTSDGTTVTIGSDVLKAGEVFFQYRTD